MRREIWEETGLKITNIKGENEATVVESNGYKVLNYSPFSCCQNIQGTYPIMVQIFICNADGELLNKSNETNNIRWISLIELKYLLESNMSLFFPMHIITLDKYIRMKLMHK